MTVETMIQELACVPEAQVTIFGPNSRDVPQSPVKLDGKIPTTPARVDVTAPWTGHRRKCYGAATISAALENALAEKEKAMEEGTYVENIQRDKSDEEIQKEKESANKKQQEKESAEEKSEPATVEEPEASGVKKKKARVKKTSKP